MGEQEVLRVGEITPSAVIGPVRLLRVADGAQILVCGEAYDSQCRLVRHGAAPVTFLRFHGFIGELARTQSFEVVCDGKPLGEFAFHSLSRDEGGLAYVTKDREGTIGIHLDNWDRRPFRTRHMSRQRLVLNLGPGTREFIYVPTDVMRALRVRGAPATSFPHTADLVDLVASGASLEYVRVPLRPGDGYLAVTDLIPHEGSTAGSRLESSAVHFFAANRGTHISTD